MSKIQLYFATIEKSLSNLEDDVLLYLQGRKIDFDLSSIVNEILRKEIEILKALEP